MKHLRKGIAIVAMWGLVAAFAFRGPEWVDAKFIIVMAVIVVLGTFVVADAGFSKFKCSHCNCGDDEED